MNLLNVLETIKKIKESGLTPNQYFILYFMLNDLELFFEINDDLKALKARGFIDEFERTTSKVYSIFTSMDPVFQKTKELEELTLKNNAVKFIRIFPPMILPTGAHARGHLSTVQERLKVFIKLYEFDWDIIFRAAENYVTRFSERGYKFMRNCPNFIMDKEGDSVLFLECEIIKNNTNIEEFGKTI